MSETLATGCDIYPKDYEGIPVDTARLLALKSIGWSPMAKPRIYRPNAIEPDRIATIDRLPIRERVIASTYYAMQLNDSSLKSLQEAANALDEVNTPPGANRSPADQKIVNNFFIASAVTEMLEDAYDRYANNPAIEEMSAKQRTAKYKAETDDDTEKETEDDQAIGWLHSLKRLREIRQADKRIPESIARSSEVILRIVIADWAETFELKKQPEIE